MADTPAQNSARSIFLEAVEHFAPDAWDEFLERACGGKTELRRRVDQLLRAHAGEDSLLDGPQATRDMSVECQQSDAVGAQVGPYRLVEQIGEGGFGVVFLAQQDQPVRRRVALKVVKPGMDTRVVIGRFEAERQALALMDHPHIAKVFDAGATPSGRPYFVMELVQGVPITDYCDQCRLTTRERLELFVLVCQAVQHAHQKGVIHRDLKPTNVLVALQDGRPAPKIIDFGVAKAMNQQLTEQTAATGFFQMIGTPMYMSPEQAELSPLGVDTRSDIYSLGILLYELLAGVTPFDKDRLHGASYDELRRIIREEEPPRPSTRLSTLRADLATTILHGRRMDARRLVHTLRGELDWIVMKCLEKDRNRRYETASSLAGDVQRYLGDEPVTACPPSTAYRIRKFARRNQGAVVAASLVFCALLVGIVGTGWQAIRATRAEWRAEANGQKAHQAVNDFFTFVSDDDALRREPTLQPLRKKLLLSTLPYYEDFVRETPTNAKLRAEQAVSCLRIAILTYETGDGENWLPWFEQGVEIVNELLEGNHDVSALVSLENGQRWIGGSVEPGAVLNFKDFGRILDRARIVWERLVRRYPSTPGFQHDLAAFYYALGGGEANDRQLALRRCTQACAIWKKLAAAYPEEPNYRAALIQGLTSLTSHHVRQRQPLEAEEAILQAVESAKSLVVDFPDDPGHHELLGLAYRELAYFLENTQCLDESEQAWRESLRTCEDLHRRYGKMRRYVLPVLIARIELGNLLYHTERFPEARQQFDEVLALDDHLDPDWQVEQFWLAWFLADCVDSELRDPPRAAEIARRLVHDAPHVAEYGITLGIARYRMGAYQAAIDALETSMQPDRFYLYSDSGYARLFLAMAHQNLGHEEIALEQYRTAVAQMENEYDWLWPRFNRAEAKQELGLLGSDDDGAGSNLRRPSRPPTDFDRPSITD